MDKNPEQEQKRKFVVVRADNNQKVAGPLTQSEAHQKANDKILKESLGNVGLSVKEVIHG
jgi:hypothetical protein